MSYIFFFPEPKTYWCVKLIPTGLDHSWSYPQNVMNKGKRYHIKSVVKELIGNRGVQNILTSNIVLIDDDKNNIALAGKYFFEVMLIRAQAY